MYKSIIQIINDNYTNWTERHTLTDGRLILSFIAVSFAGFALAYDYLNPFPKSKTVKNLKNFKNYTFIFSIIDPCNLFYMLFCDDVIVTIVPMVCGKADIFSSRRKRRQKFCSLLEVVF